MSKSVYLKATCGLAKHALTEYAYKGKTCYRADGEFTGFAQDFFNGFLSAIQEEFVSLHQANPSLSIRQVAGALRESEWFDSPDRPWVIKDMEKTDNDWLNDYGCIEAHRFGGDIHAYHFDSLEDAKKVADGNINRIWTLVTGTGHAPGIDCEWITPGIRIVNAWAYLVSVKEWDEASVSTSNYLWREYEADDEGDA